MNEKPYDRHLGVDSDQIDNALVISIWDRDHFGVERQVRIPVENIPDFLRDVTNHAMQSLTRAAKRLEVGHCETCGNTGLVPVERHGRPSNQYCPDCRDRWPAEPFAAAPKIGRKES